MLKQLSLLALVALSGARADPAAADAKCADVLVLTTRGSTEFEPDPPTIAPDTAQVVSAKETKPMKTGEGEMGAVAMDIQNSTAGITINRQAVIYPALDDTPANYHESFVNGTNTLVKIIQEATSQCKDQKIVLLGYSQGAHVVGDALSGPGGSIWGKVGPPALDPETYSKKIAAVVFWGDPRHNQTDQTSFVVGFPNATMDGYFPRTQGQDDILKKYYGGRLISYCTDHDKYCSSGVLGADMISAGNKSENIHIYSYMQDAVKPAVAFVQERIKDVKGSSGSASESGSATASSTATGTKSTSSPSASGKSAASHVGYSVTGALAVAGLLALQIFML